MTRYSHLIRLLPLGALAAAGVMSLSAAPAGATIVCPSGITPPSPYCSNVPPTAATGAATNVGTRSATLNGVAGPNVAGGDPTQYFFQYGPSPAYGSQTPPGTIGSCPAGISPPSPYCNTPATQAVSADISNLEPCTTYHYQLVATNPDGSANGGDKTFTTAFAPPLTHVHAPHSVRRHHRFKVQFTLRFAAQVRIVIKKSGGRVVQTYSYGTLGPGKHKETLIAPGKRGRYVIEVIAKMSCGKQAVFRRLRVH